jgi:hypothetical protein
MLGDAVHAPWLAVRGRCVLDQKRGLAGGRGEALREGSSEEKDQRELDHRAVMRREN